MTIEFSEVNEAKPSAIPENKATEAFQKEAFTFGAVPERQNGHGGNGGVYPYPLPWINDGFQKSESKLSVSPPGKIVPTIELTAKVETTAMMAKPMTKADAMVNGRYPEQDEAIRRHHHGQYPYPVPRFHPPESSISVSPPGKVRH